MSRWGVQVAAVALLIGITSAPAAAQVFKNVPAANSSFWAEISGNGRFVAGVVTDPPVCGSLGAMRPASGVFVYDTRTSAVECISVNDDGVPAPFGGNYEPSIDATGDLVAFTSDAPGLDPRCEIMRPAGVPARSQIYVRNRRTGHTECVSVNDAGVAGDAGSYSPAISAMGNMVVFLSMASNFVPGGPSQLDLFAVRLVDGSRSGPIVRLPLGAGSGPNDIEAPALNADGRFVVFSTNRAGVVPNDTNGAFDVFRHDLVTGQTVRVNVSATGRQVTGESREASVSSDGRFVSFTSTGRGLNDDFIFPQGIYRRDLLTGVVLLASGYPSPDGRSYSSRLSADGQVMVFRSDAANLGFRDTNGVNDVFATDLRSGSPQISRLSIALAGGERNGTHDFYPPSISADGSVAAFSSSATNLAPDGAPGARVFLARIPTSPVRLLIGAGAGAGPRVRVPTPFAPGDLLRDFLAYDPRFSGGVTVAFGDVDGDGAADIVTGAGAGGGPHVRVFSAARHAAESTGPPGEVPNELASVYAYNPYFQGGVSVAVADVTGDGIGDIITGAGPGGGPHVRVFQVHTSWATGTAQLTEYASFFAYQPAFTGGVRVAAGDLDGDGISEILTAAGPGGGPHVRAFRLGIGGTPVPVLSFFAYDGAFSGGVFVAAGDVDGDGRDEIVTGADAGGGPHVRVFVVGAGFSSLRERYSFFAYDPGFTGGVRVAAGDVDGDGRAELMTAPGPRGTGQVRVLKAVGATDLMQFSAYSVSSTAGGFIAAPH